MWDSDRWVIIGIFPLTSVETEKLSYPAQRWHLFMVLLWNNPVHFLCLIVPKNVQECQLNMNYKVGGWSAPLPITQFEKHFLCIFHIQVETNFKLTKLSSWNFTFTTSMCGKDVFATCWWDISLLLYYSAQDEYPLLCSKHGFINDIFLLLNTMWCWYVQRFHFLCLDIIQTQNNKSLQLILLLPYYVMLHVHWLGWQREKISW